MRRALTILALAAIAAAALAGGAVGRVGDPPPAWSPEKSAVEVQILAFAALPAYLVDQMMLKGATIYAVCELDTSADEWACSMWPSNHPRIVFDLRRPRTEARVFVP